MKELKETGECLLQDAAEDMRYAFSDVTVEQARRLREGLTPFRQAGNWIEALCLRLEEMLSDVEWEDWKDWIPNDIFVEEWHGLGPIH